MSKKPYHFLCLCPIWNHRHATTQSAIACFVEQRLPDNVWATLILIDDRPPDDQHTAKSYQSILDYRGGIPARDRKFIRSRFMWRRAASLGEKYNEGLEAAAHWYGFHDRGGTRDAAEAVAPEVSHIAIWDDDDLFLPGHLEQAVAVYEADPDVQWTYPTQVFSTYGNNPHIEEGDGRFWSSSTFSIWTLTRAGGFVTEKIAGYDQATLGKLRATGHKCGRPILPTYVYRWEGENHTSGYSNGFHDTQWYEDTPHSTSKKLSYAPLFDVNASWTFDELAQKFPNIWGVVGSERLAHTGPLSGKDDELEGHARWG